MPARRYNSSLRPSILQEMTQRVHPGISYVGILFEVEPAAELGAWFASFPEAIEQIVEQWIDAACRNIRILLQVKSRVEVQIRLAPPLDDTVRQIVEQRVDSRFRHIGVLCQVERGIEE